MEQAMPTLIDAAPGSNSALLARPYPQRPGHPVPAVQPNSPRAEFGIDDVGRSMVAQPRFSNPYCVFVL